MKDCNDCEHICPSESHQTKNREAHICNHSKGLRRVYHEGQHPILPVPPWCPLEGKEMANDPRIAIAQALSKIKGAEKSPYVLVAEKSLVSMKKEGEEVVFLPPKTTYRAVPRSGRRGEIIGSWLNNSSFDGEWSSASIREGLGLNIDFDDHHVVWSVHWETKREVGAGNYPTIRYLVLDDPKADDLANNLGIIEYHKQYPQEVEDYLKSKC